MFKLFRHAATCNPLHTPAIRQTTAGNAIEGVRRMSKSQWLSPPTLPASQNATGSRSNQYSIVRFVLQDSHESTLRRARDPHINPQQLEQPYLIPYFWLVERARWASKFPSQNSTQIRPLVRPSGQSRANGIGTRHPPILLLKGDTSASSSPTEQPLLHLKLLRPIFPSDTTGILADPGRMRYALLTKFTTAISDTIQDSVNLVDSPDYSLPAEDKLLIVVAVGDYWACCHADIHRLKAYGSESPWPQAQDQEAIGDYMCGARSGQGQHLKDTPATLPDQPGHGQLGDPGISASDLAFVLGWDAADPPFQLSAVHRLGTEGSEAAWEYIEGVVAKY